MPLPLTVSCFSKIQIGFPFWYRLTWAVLDKGPLNGCVCVCDMLSVDGGADAAVEARIRIGWNKFRQLVPLLTNKDVSLIIRGRLYSTEVPTQKGQCSSGNAGCHDHCCSNLFHRLHRLHTGRGHIPPCPTCSLTGRI